MHRSTDRPTDRPTGRPRIACGPLLALRCTVLAFFVFPVAAFPAAPSPGEPGWSVEARDLLIETVTIEGVQRASPELILGESLLEAGRSYSERELEVAVRRIRRLPFVLDAHLTLRKGSHRGAYELVVAIIESRRFFFGVNLDWAVFGSPLALEDDLDDRTARLADRADDLALAAGARWFAGSHGVVFVGLDNEGVRAGAVQYNLFGRHVLGSVQMAANDSCCVQRVFPLGVDPALGRWSLHQSRQIGLEVGVPLSAERSVRVSLHGLDSDDSARSEIFDDRLPRFFKGDRLEYWRLAAHWVQDSTDDPVLPTRGSRVAAGLAVESLESRQVVQTFGRGPIGPGIVTELLPPFDSLHFALEGSGVRHFDATPRQTVSVAGTASVGRSTVDNLLVGSTLHPEEDFTSYGISGAVRWSLDLRDPRRIRSRRTDLRLEMEIGYGWEALSPRLDLAGTPLETMDLQVALVLRNAWGVFRFGLTYLEAGEVLR